MANKETSENTAGLEETAKRAELIASQQGMLYFRECERQGVSPDDPYLSERGEADIANAKRSALEKVAAISQSDMDERFYKAAQGINVEDPFAETETKRKHLQEIYGYNFLWGSGGVRIPISQASQKKVGLAYQQCYKKSKKTIKDKQNKGA